MVKIDLLKNHPDAIPVLAKLWYDQKARAELHPHMTFAQACARFTPPQDDTLPLILAAFVAGKPVGMCGLRVDENIRPDLSPWAFGLIVDPAYRNQGIARLLVDARFIAAKKLGFKKLYLLTSNPTAPAWFARMGWQEIGIEPYRDHPVVVMELDIGQ